MSHVVGLAEIIRIEADKPSPAEQVLLRKRRAVLRWDDHGRFWYVVYYQDGQRRFVLDWLDWVGALDGALRWVGLAW